MYVERIAKSSVRELLQELGMLRDELRELDLFDGDDLSANLEAGIVIKKNIEHVETELKIRGIDI